MASNSSKRIVKNTVFLYVRMLLVMAISLYTSRLILNILGVEDYGIYNVVGGFITIIGFLNSSLSSATQRFLSFELGKNDPQQFRKVFCMSMNIHAIMALIIFLLGETAGLWFVKTMLTIPAERMEAALWVYHFSILTFMTTVISVPYNAAIIATEEMKLFAQISFIEVSLKLLAVFVLMIVKYDSLIVYALLIFLISIIIRLIYAVYFTFKFPQYKYRFIWDQKLFRTLTSFSLWNLWGNTAAALYGQGINILLNIFFGPVVNAARGVAYQVRAAANSFVQNFQLAMNPQIVKSFAEGNLAHMHQLVCSGSKFSYYLMLMLSLPILLEAELLLTLWLKIVPDKAILFTRLAIIAILIDSLSGTIITAAQASGKIRLYQSIIGGFLLLILPVSYLFLKLGYPPESTFYIVIIFSLTSLFLRLYIIKGLIKLTFHSFVKDVLSPVAIVTSTSLILPFLFKNFITGIQGSIAVITASLFSVVAISFLLGMTKSEKKYLLNMISSQLKMK